MYGPFWVSLFISKNPVPVLHKLKHLQRHSFLPLYCIYHLTPCFHFMHDSKGFILFSVPYLLPPFNVSRFFSLPFTPCIYICTASTYLFHLNCWHKLSYYLADILTNQQATHVTTDECSLLLCQNNCKIVRYLVSAALVEQICGGNSVHYTSLIYTKYRPIASILYTHCHNPT